MIFGVASNLLLPRLINTRTAQIRQLPLATATSLANLPLGARVVIEGKISPTQPTRFRQFVAFVREQISSQRANRSYWIEIGRSTPPLQINAADGAVRISNDNYDLQTTSEVWEDTVQQTQTRQRYVGFKPGSEVVAVGRVERSPSGTQIYAEFVAAGTRAEYSESQDQTVIVLRIIGIVVAFLGLWVLWLVVRDLG